MVMSHSLSKGTEVAPGTEHLEKSEMLSVQPQYGMMRGHGRQGWMRPEKRGMLVVEGLRSRWGLDLVLTLWAVFWELYPGLSYPETSGLLKRHHGMDLLGVDGKAVRRLFF